MASPLREIRILGVHPVPSSEEFGQALELQWGAGLAGSDLARAQLSVQDHFSHLFLIEIQIQPANANIDWSEFGQPISARKNRTGKSLTMRDLWIPPLAGGCSFCIWSDATNLYTVGRAPVALSDTDTSPS
jgi:hypothetical protein